jgi:hypothetical protein
MNIWWTYFTNVTTQKEVRKDMLKQFQEMHKNETSKILNTFFSGEKGHNEPGPSTVGRTVLVRSLNATEIKKR